jgi:predicted RND superfamily exporter protein
VPLRAQIEAAFSRWGRFVVRRRWLAIAACLGLSTALVSRLPELRVDNSDEAFLHQDDQARLRYDRFREQFGRDDHVLVVLQPREIFDLGFLETLRDLHREIEREIPYVEEVTSLLNARNTRGEADELIVEDLLEDWPASDADLAALRERVLSNPLYVNLLISEDEELTVLDVQPFTYSTRQTEADELGGFGEARAGPAAPAYLTDEEGFELTLALQELLERYETPELQIHLIGGPVFEYHIFQGLQDDASVFMVLSNLTVVLLLVVLFRRFWAVVLPVIVVLLAMLSTMGLMVWLDIPFSVTLNMLPAFLLVVGVCDSIHLLVIFYRRLDAGRTREEAIADAIGHSGLAVVMTSVTTAVGLLSFSLAEIAPIAQLGVLAPAGVMLALAYTLALLPALLAVVPMRPAPRRRGVAGRGALDAFLARVGDLTTRHPWRVAACSAAVLLAALPGVLAVRFSHDARRWLPDGDPMKTAWLLLDERFKGVETLEVLVDTGRENGLHDPDALRRLESAMRYSETLSVDGLPVNKAISIVDVLKETHQALNENRPEFYVLPEERRLIAQELLLFENSGSDDLGDVTDTGFRTGRMTIRTPTADALLYPGFMDEMAAGLGGVLGPALPFEFTGGLALFSRVMQAVTRSMAVSYAFALAVITPLMVLLIGDLRRGLVAMIPNLIPVYLVLALMGWAGIPIDMSTLLIGGVIVGLAVDDTIHFMHKFGRYYEESGNPRAAVHETLATTGSALLFTSLVLCLGFSVFLFAYMQNTFWFGLLAATGVAVAFLADVLLGPALMVLVTRDRSAVRDRDQGAPRLSSRLQVPAPCAEIIRKTKQ